VPGASSSPSFTNIRAHAPGLFIRFANRTAEPLKMNARPVELSQSRATHKPARLRPMATSGIASFKILASGRRKLCGLEVGAAQNPGAAGDPCLMLIAVIEVRPGCFCFAPRTHAAMHTMCGFGHMNSRERLGPSHKCEIKTVGCRPVEREPNRREYLQFAVRTQRRKQAIAMRIARQISRSIGIP